MVELLAPAGNFNKLKTALHFGADAVYLAGKEFGLRAYSDNFSEGELEEAVRYTHARGKKAYVTFNVYARNEDFQRIPQALALLQDVGADAVLVSDPGVLLLAKKFAPALPVHLSTQANTTNRYAAAFWAAQGVSRIVLARELSLAEIAEIADEVGKTTELEAFVHGAMCVSYSGRCLLSNYFTGRDANRGACVQACRWQYEIREADHPEKPLLAEEDARGTYLMSSRDLNMLGYLDRLAAAGVTSFKIEGRMKSEYYVATVVNAYRRALDAYLAAPQDYRPDPTLAAELDKAARRPYTTAYYLGENRDTECYDAAADAQGSVFVAEVKGYDAVHKVAEVEMRNRFRAGETLTVLSPGPAFGKSLRVAGMRDAAGQPVEDALLVQQRLFLPCTLPLAPHDILRREVQENRQTRF